MTTLALICGLPGAGKTTLARRLENFRPALRLCPDEWIKAIIKDEADQGELDRLRDPVEALQWQTARRLLTLGVSVILENGYWSRAERERVLTEARALGVRVEMHYLAVSRDELWQRIERRNAAGLEGSFRVTRAQLDLWWSWFEPPDSEELARYDPVASAAFLP